MLNHRHLPFVGLLVLASFVAMVAGVGDVSDRTSRNAGSSATGQAAIQQDAPVHPGRRDP